MTEDTLKRMTDAATVDYPAFVRVAWMQATTNDDRSKTIAALGLMGEAGEVCEIIKKRVRGDVGEHVSDEKLLLELGDVWFYLTLVCHQWGLDASGGQPMGRLDAFAWACGLGRCASKLAWLAMNHIQSPVYKNTSGMQRKAVPLAVCIRELLPQGLTMADLEAANVKKLTDRYRNNGTLRGFGDR